MVVKMLQAYVFSLHKLLAVLCSLLKRVRFRGYFQRYALHKSTFYLRFTYLLTY